MKTKIYKAKGNGMTRHLAFLPLYLFTLLLLTSCGDFLKEYSQDEDYVRSWEDLNELLIGSAYQPTFSATYPSNTNDNQYFIHFLSDELDENRSTYNEYSFSYDDKEKVFGYYTWQARTDQNDTYTGYNDGDEKGWTDYYNRINVCNNIIESAADLNENGEAARLGHLKVDGEARFLRAYYYFMLTNLYGKAYNPSTASNDLAVPIKTSENVEDKQFARNTVQECYDLILNDLNIAETELSEYGSQPSKYRADSVAVQLLKSRVYLYMQNWSEAARYARLVINEHPSLQNLNSTQNTDGIITTNSPELIFSMGSNAVMEYTMNQLKTFTISDSIYRLYDDNDLRKVRYMWTDGNFHGYTKFPANSTAITNEGVTEEDANYYFTAYYYGWQSQTNDVSDKNYFRSAEAYLNLAEAEACQGNDAAALEAINHLRQYRYAAGSDYQLTSSGDQLIRDIRTERLRELLLEGHRWFDLRRYAVSSVCPQTTTITHHYYYYESRESSVATTLHTFKLVPGDWGWTLPIPQEAIDFNTPLMQQNERGTRTYTTSNP